MEEHVRWTGVWDANNPGSPALRWLVSGVNPEPGSAGDEIMLVGPNTAGPISAGHVRVALMDLETDDPEGTGTVTAGRYAWWVGDEGVKARGNLRDRHADSALDPMRARARHILPQRMAIESVSGMSSIVSHGADLDRVIQNNQLSLLSGGAPGVSDVRRRFHDITSVSRGVLANARDGGLKYDLSAYVESGNAASAAPGGVVPSTRAIATGVPLSYVRSWAQLGAAAGGFGSSIEPVRFDGSIQHGAHPMIVRHSHFFGVSYEGEQLRVHYMPVFALWNPYDVGLAAADYVIEVDIPGRLEFTGDGSGQFVLPSTMEFVLRAVDLRPGECRLVSASDATPWVPFQSSGGSNLLAAGWRGDSAFFLPLTGRIPPESSAPTIEVGLTPYLSGPAVIRLRLVTPESTSLIQESVDQARFDLLPGSEVAISPSAMEPPTPLLYDGMVGFGWYLQPAGDEVDPDDDSKWITIEHAGAPSDWPQQRLNSTRGTGFTGYSWLRPTRPNDSESGQDCVIFWHIPRSNDVPLLSLGDLRHMRLASEQWQPRYLWDLDGGAAASAEIWDSYFFSGFLPSLTQPEIDDQAFAPMNGRIRFLRRDGRGPARSDVVYTGDPGSHPFDTCAAHVMVDGVFNVNSVSVDAWRALFSSYAGVPVETGQDEEEPLDSPLRHPYPRFPYPHREALDPTVDGRNSVEAWAGYRRLTDAQVESLARQWAEHVADRGQPYTSMEELVNDPFWADSIAAAGINSPAFTGVGGPPNGLAIPGVFTKWDLLARLLPVLAVRSDTFLVRAYGETLNPVTEAVEARAWCEAVVQRLPEYVDPSDEPWERSDLSMTNQRFGRRFVITSFRWLSPDDI